jgi:opacity protein-like surface antigen
MLNGRMAFFAAALAGATMAASPSLAADPTYWDQPSPTFDWSGFYVGAHVGAGSSRIGWVFVPGGTTANHTPSPCPGRRGFFVAAAWPPAGSRPAHVSDASRVVAR